MFKKDSQMNKTPAKVNNDLLLDRIGIIISEARQRTVQTINTILVKTYWEIGREIVEHELGGKSRAEYGGELLKNLSAELKERYGKGFSYRNLQLMKQFYHSYSIVQTLSAQSLELKDSTLSSNLEFEKVQTVSAKSVLSEKMLSRLSWSHICLLLAVSDEDTRSFYEIEIAQNGWSVREAKRQIESMLFERLALSKDKKGLLKLSQKGQIINKPEDAIKDPYVLEFLGLEETERWHESDLEQALMDQLQKFLLELGKGFMFVSRQMRISINNEHYHIDMVFYNKRLRSYVLIDLKAGKFDHADYGQMKFYLNYFKEELNEKNDNEPIGMILCYEKDDEFVKYVLKDEKTIFAKKYLMSLPDKQKLLAEVKRLKDIFIREHLQIK
jgi:predicted nuclease of restriction endonuclease-like (RecB) superfamily